MKGFCHMQTDSSHPDSKSIQNSVPVPPQSSLSDALKSSVPSTLKVQLPANATVAASETIKQDNSDTASILNNAQIAAIEAFSRIEQQRAERQEPLLNHIIKLTYIQIIVFNFVIIAIGACSFVLRFMGIESDLTFFFEILKYYIGVTVVEFIAMVGFIMKASFSSDHMKAMKMFFQKEAQDDSTPKKGKP